MDKEHADKLTETSATKDHEGSKTDIGPDAISDENLDTVSGGPMFSVNSARVDPYK